MNALPLSLYLPSRAKLWCTLQLRKQILYSVHSSPGTPMEISCVETALNTSMCVSFNFKKIRRIAREVTKTLIFSSWLRYYTDEAELVKIIYASRSACYFFLCFQQKKCDVY